MSLTMGPSNEAAAQVFTEAGYSKVEIVTRRHILIGRHDAWLVTVTAQGQDDKRYEVDLPMVETFGGWSGVMNAMRTREID